MSAENTTQHARPAIEPYKLLPNFGEGAVSYTHLTLPTT